MIIPGFPTPFVTGGISGPAELTLGTVNVYIDYYDNTYWQAGFSSNSPYIDGSISNNSLVKLGSSAFDIQNIVSNFQGNNFFELLCGDAEIATNVLNYIQSNATWLQATDLSWRAPTSTFGIHYSNTQNIKILNASGYPGWSSTNYGQTKTMEWA